MHKTILAEREHIATKLHRCDACDELIMPGDRYRVSVFVYVGRHPMLMERREHVAPTCPYPYGDEEPEQLSQSNIYKIAA